MKNFINRIHVGGLMLLAAVLILTVSWKSLNSDSHTTKWYVVQPIDQDLPYENDNLRIVPAPIDALTGDCGQGYDILCAVELRIEGPFPATMQDAENFPGVTIVKQAHRE